MPSSTAQDQGAYPSLSLDNGDVRLTAFLPDPERGFYRGVRMDRSLMLDDVTVRGHRVFTRYHPGVPHDPFGHDHVTGPTEEFDIFGPETYAEAPVGGLFLKIGVGVLRRDAPTDYRFAALYPVVDAGGWTVEADLPRAVRFIHTAGLPDGSRSYRLERRVVLPERGCGLRIERAITNTGRRPIASWHYNHNFIRFDAHDVGPAYTVETPFRLSAEPPVAAPGRLEGSCLTWSGPIDGAFYTILGGQSRGEVAHHTFTVRHAAGGSLRYASDVPLADFRVFATSLTVCPEPFTSFRVEPGGTFRWNSEFTFGT